MLLVVRSPPAFLFTLAAPRSPSSIPVRAKKEDTQIVPINYCLLFRDAAFSGMGISPGLKKCPPDTFLPWLRQGRPLRFPYGQKKTHTEWCVSFFGDPYGNRTHVTAVKGRCLNRLTNGPGSGDLIRTGDIPGMNRLLYQLSYAAILSKSPKVLCHYIQGFGVCQEKSLHFPKIFWETCF